MKDNVFKLNGAVIIQIYNVNFSHAIPFSYTKWIKGVHKKMAANGFYVNLYTLSSDYGWLVCVMKFLTLSK